MPKHIEQIAAIHKQGSFCRAAEKLNISQPALSRSILALEEKLGVKFFDRVRGNLELTQYGSMILSRGEGILKEIQLLHRDLRMLKNGEQGTLNLGCGPIPAETLAGEAIARFNSLYPQITLKLSIDHVFNLTKRLNERTLDFFVAEAHHLAGKQEYELRPMPQQQGYFCCRKDHPLHGLPTVSFRDILDYPLALMWLSDRIYALFSKLAGRRIQSNEDLSSGSIQCDNMNMLLCIVNSSDAICMTSREILSASHYKDEVALLPLVVPELKTGYSIVSLKGYSTIQAITSLQNIFIETALQKVQA